MRNTGIRYNSKERMPTVLSEMAELLPPLSGEQLAVLEADLLANGCYAPVIVNEDMVIVDGHNRQKLCQQHGIPYRQQFYFLRDNDIATPENMAAFLTRTEDALASLTKQRTILNVRKKKRQVLYTALADVEALAIAKELYEDGVSGMEEQLARYLDAVARLEGCGCSREQLLREKAEVYQRLAEVNRQIRQERQKLAICREIQKEAPQMERSIQYTMEPEEVRHDERRRR